MGCIPRHSFCIKAERIDDTDRIGTVCAQEQLGIVELVEVVDRISRSEFDSLDLLQIDIENLLLVRSLAAEF